MGATKHNSDAEELNTICVQVAGEAADLVAEAHTAMLAGDRVSFDTKTSETDVVTAVDIAAEELIRRRLAELRPGDNILGEEGGNSQLSNVEQRSVSDPADSTGSSGKPVTWVVDPIDGTVNFLYGIPWFAVSIAAQLDGVSVAGAVVEPASRRCWSAVRGQGAWLDGRRLRVSEPAELATTLVATGFAYRPELRVRQARFAAELLARVRDIRRFGAASLDLCALAAGWVDGYLEHNLHPWDWAAGALIASEAGAVVALPGQDDRFGSNATFAAAPSIADSLAAAAVECGFAEVDQASGSVSS